MTNVDFHVTPPIRSMSVSEVMDPHDTRNQDYFRSDISGNYSSSTSVIPEQNAYESPTNDIDVANTDHVSTPTERTFKVDSTTLDSTPASANLKSGLRDVKHKPSSDRDRTTSTDSHHTTLQREKSFGTNLTTGKREYISHYQRGNTDNGESIELQEVGHSSATAAAGSDDSASDMNRRSDSDSMRETDTSTDYARDSETSTDVDIY
ncbi:hypothetical protein QFC21_005479 [Naganishia friedmannii]|uniref:Uncharacterized protein n=1 Tax=Naganishia friedmannii TaxID=89922 RepID=A0ACC2V914_9TREE|nr:hypothetical protein QFC21_005479 [Naganishia friedmannii]